MQDVACVRVGRHNFFAMHNIAIRQPTMARTRPLSPHLQVYRLPLLALLSISHRATGVLLVAGSLVLVYWLTAVASGPDAFSQAQAILGSIPGRAFLLVITFSLFYHLSNGIRHLFWDAGLGFELRTAHASGILVIVAAVVLTLVAWALGYAMR